MSRINSSPPGVVSTAFVLLLAVAGPVLADQPRQAFVTSSTGTTDLGSWEDAGGATGLAAADAICQARAADAGLANPGNFVAWISGNDDDAYCRVHGLSGKKSANCGQGSLPAAAGPWVRTDRVPFAAAIERMLVPELEIYTPPRFDEFGVRFGPTPFLATATSEDGALAQSSCSDLFTGLVLDEFGQTPVDVAAWTGSFGSGAATPQNCQGWSSSNAADWGTAGLSDRANSAWTFWAASACNQQRRLYCLSDAVPRGDPVFQDRFESP